MIFVEFVVLAYIVFPVQQSTSTLHTHIQTHLDLQKIKLTITEHCTVYMSHSNGCYEQPMCIATAVLAAI